MNKYYISIDPTYESTAWYKAVSDVEYFLGKFGFKPLTLRDSVHIGADGTSSGISSSFKGDGAGMIVVQYPRTSSEGLNLPVFAAGMKAVNSMIKIVGLVHDLDSLRYGEFFTTMQMPEIDDLNCFDYIIAVNDAMSDLLNSCGIRSKVLPLHIFDYVLDEDALTDEGGFAPNDANGACETNGSGGQKKIKIAYAGNLKYAKSPFIYRLSELNLGNIEFLLYGPWFDLSWSDCLNDNIKYCGNFLADKLPNQLKVDYGLCWDGDEINCLSGKIGKYLSYTNPHKTSLYLACGIPVVISGAISTASFIKNENAGIVVDDLHDLPALLNGVDAAEYQIFRNNALNISKKLRSGYFLKSVIDNIEKQIECEEN